MYYMISKTLSSHIVHHLLPLDEPSWSSRFLYTYLLQIHQWRDTKPRRWANPKLSPTIKNPLPIICFQLWTTPKCIITCVAWFFDPWNIPRVQLYRHETAFELYITKRIIFWVLICWLVSVYRTWISTLSFVACCNIVLSAFFTVLVSFCTCQHLVN